MLHLALTGVHLISTPQWGVNENANSGSLSPTPTWRLAIFESTLQLRTLNSRWYDVLNGPRL